MEPGFQVNEPLPRRNVAVLFSETLPFSWVITIWTDESLSTLKRTWVSWPLVAVAGPVKASVAGLAM